MSQDERLNAMLLPLRDAQLLLPNLAMADALAASELRPAADGAPDWLAGWIVWQSLDLPVLHFERLHGSGLAVSGRRARVVVLKPANASTGLPRCGLLCDGHPQLLSLRRDAIEALPLRASDAAERVLARVRVDGREALIPDLAAIEARLAALLEAGTAVASAS